MPKRLENSQLLRKTWHVNQRSDKFSWILTLTEVISIRILRMCLISAIMNFYLSHAIPLQKLSKERSYKFSWILTLTEVINIWILRMRIISAIINFNWSDAIPLQKLSYERSYKFSWILTLTEVISIRNLRFFYHQREWCPLITPWLDAAEPNWQSRKIVRRWLKITTDLRSNTHSC